MGLLKASDAPPQGVVRLSLRDIEAEARAAIETATREGHALIAGARARAAEIEIEARARGIAEGHAEGISRGLDEGRRLATEQHRNEIEQVVRTLAQAVEQVNAAREDFESESLRDVVDLAIAIARRVTKRQAQIDPQVLLANLRDALAMTGRGGEVRVAIHPAQRQVLIEAMPLLRAEWPAVTESCIVEDASLSVGGCRVFTQHGRIDADLSAQLDRVVADLLPDPSNDNGSAS